MWRTYWNFLSLPSWLPDYLQERMNLLNIVSCIFPNTEIILYGKGDLDNINNTSMLDAIINYLIETKRFDAQFFFLLFGCHGFNIDIAFKIHIFVLFTVFLVSIIFIFLLFLGYFFNLVCTFVPRYITIFICIPDDYKFWWF